MSILLPIGNREYGFIDAGPADRTYAVTGDYSGMARNHCAATMLTNAVQILCPECRDPQMLFHAIHAIVGNGPVLHLERKANRYLSDAALPWTCHQINRGLTESSPTRLVQIAGQELTQGRPVALLVAASPLRWHWVLALPHQAPFLISDSWHARRVYRYAPDQGARLMGIVVFQSTPHP